MSDIAGEPIEVYRRSSTQGSSEVRLLAEQARRAARAIAPMSLAQRNASLTAIAEALVKQQHALLAANAEDLHLADALVATGDLSPANRARLGLTTAKLEEMAAQVRAVRELPDPLGRRLEAMELDRGLDLEKRSVSLGVLAVIFEARPDAVTQISALALKSGNAVILKPGREVERTAAALVSLIRAAIRSASLPEDAVSVIFGRAAVAELLTLSSLVDLVIPRGSRALVEHIQATTRIPVLGHADGICHIYVDRSVDAEQALAVIDDAKTDYPAVCNAVETVLVHQAVALTFLPALVSRLSSKGVRLLGDAGVRAVLSTELAATVGEVEEWHTEYGDLTLALRVVPSIEAAIEHIHVFGSAHTESICTTNADAAERFLNEVDAASVMVNASTRFADGFRYGLGAEVGVSTSRIHARGPVGLEGLTTTKYLVRGHGHLAGDYRGPQAKVFTHRRIS
jgi:glutamate-5-semialdehyde dehydrogenase